MAHLHFPPKVIDKMKSLGLSEADVNDVYYHGEHGTSYLGSHRAVKKYPTMGIEIGIYYKASKFYSGDVVLSVWKRERG